MRRGECARYLRCPKMVSRLPFSLSGRLHDEVFLAPGCQVSQVRVSMASMCRDQLLEGAEPTVLPTAKSGVRTRGAALSDLATHLPCITDTDPMSTCWKPKAQMISAGARWLELGHDFKLHIQAKALAYVQPHLDRALPNPSTADGWGTASLALSKRPPSTSLACPSAPSP